MTTAELARNGVNVAAILEAATTESFLRKHAEVHARLGLMPADAVAIPDGGDVPHADTGRARGRRGVPMRTATAGHLDYETVVVWAPHRPDGEPDCADEVSRTASLSLW